MPTLLPVCSESQNPLGKDPLLAAGKDVREPVTDLVGKVGRALLEE